MANKETIAVDIDDVLADNARGFAEFSNQRWGTNLTPRDYDEHWAKVWGVDNKETEKRADVFHGSGIFKAYEHNDVALPVLERLSDHYRLLVITSRQRQTQEDTTAWIHRHYPGIFSDDTIHFAGIWDKVEEQSIGRTKGDIAVSLNVDYLIDDQLKHCRAIAGMGKRALLFGNYTWNQDSVLPEGVDRVAGWKVVGEYLDG